jgi:hypothetical protein
MEQLRGEPSGPLAHHHGNHIERLAHVSLELVEYSKRVRSRYDVVDLFIADRRNKR